MGEAEWPPPRASAMGTSTNATAIASAVDTDTIFSILMVELLLRVTSWR
jgi:hypothetical protein